LSAPCKAIDRLPPILRRIIAQAAAAAQYRADEIRGHIIGLQAVIFHLRHLPDFFRQRHARQQISHSRFDRLRGILIDRYFAARRRDRGRGGRRWRGYFKRGRGRNRQHAFIRRRSDRAAWHAINSAMAAIACAFKPSLHVSSFMLDNLPVVQVQHSIGIPATSGSCETINSVTPSSRTICEQRQHHARSRCLIRQWVHRPESGVLIRQGAQSPRAAAARRTFHTGDDAATASPNSDMPRRVADWPWCAAVRNINSTFS
jgi:hypothetical protein